VSDYSTKNNMGAGGAIVKDIGGGGRKVSEGQTSFSAEARGRQEKAPDLKRGSAGGR